MIANSLDRARHAFADRIIEYATANATVELPDLMVDREVEMMVDELKVRVAQQGIRYEDYLRVTEKTEESLRDGLSRGRPSSASRCSSSSAPSPSRRPSTCRTRTWRHEIAHLRAEGEASASVSDYLDTDRGRAYIRSQLRRSALVELLVDRWIAAHPEFADVQHQHQPHDHDEPVSADLVGDALLEETTEDEADEELAALEAAAAEGVDAMTHDQPSRRRHVPPRRST